LLNFIAEVAATSSRRGTMVKGGTSHSNDRLPGGGSLPSRGQEQLEIVRVGLSAVILVLLAFFLPGVGAADEPHPVPITVEPRANLTTVPETPPDRGIVPPNLPQTGITDQQPASPGESQQAPSEQTGTWPGASLPQQLAGKPTAENSGASGMMIYIDPQTGAILQEPAPGTVPLQLTPQFQNAFSTSHQGLVEVPSAVPGGGVEVDLQGRFQHPFIATIDANGKLKMQHLHELPQSGD
jgi:hypothetical protein